MLCTVFHAGQRQCMGARCDSRPKHMRALFMIRSPFWTGVPCGERLVKCDDVAVRTLGLCVLRGLPWVGQAEILKELWAENQGNKT